MLNKKVANMEAMYTEAYNCQKYDSDISHELRGTIIERIAQFTDNMVKTCANINDRVQS